MRAGLALKQRWALEAAGAKLCSCSHPMGAHFELNAETYKIVGETIVSTPNPLYKPLHFHCRECSCVREEGLT